MEWMGRIGRDETSDINGVVCDKVDRQTDEPNGWTDGLMGGCVDGWIK